MGDSRTVEGGKRESRRMKRIVEIFEQVQNEFTAQHPDSQIIPRCDESVPCWWFEVREEEKHCG